MHSAFVGSDQAFGVLLVQNDQELYLSLSLSLFACQRTELRSQEVNKRSYVNNGVACVFESAYCVFAYV